MKFSIIVAFKNREEKRVRLFLDSLEWQTIKNFEVIFVNQGSDETVNKWLEPLLLRYSFIHYIHNFTKGYLWNKSNALNIGIKESDGNYIVIADIDIIFPKTFLEQVEAKVNLDVFLTYNANYISDQFEIKEIATLFHLYNKSNCYEHFIGLCVASKEAFTRVKGYDEFYLVWGAEDDDIINRLERIGLQRQHIPAEYGNIFHQWHKSRAPGKPGLWYITMVNHLFSSYRSKNSQEEIGIRTKESDRIIFKMIKERQFNVTLKLYLDNPFLIYNNIIKDFYNPINRSGCFEYDNQNKIKGGRNNIMFPWIKNKPKEIIYSIEDILDFLHYLIGYNMNHIKDYYLETANDFIRFYYIKRDIDG